MHENRLIFCECTQYRLRVDAQCACVPICSLGGWYRGIALVEGCTIKIRRGLSLDEYPTQK